MPNCWEMKCSDCGCFDEEIGLCQFDLPYPGFDDDDDC